METDNQETERRKAKDKTGTGIMEYNMTQVLTDEKRYGNSETKDWNDKNFIRSKKTGKMKIGNLTVGLHNHLCNFGVTYAKEEL